jgi:hypothetical protein
MWQGIDLFLIGDRLTDRLMSIGLNFFIYFSIGIKSDRPGILRSLICLLFGCAQSFQRQDTYEWLNSCDSKKASQL